MMKNYITLVLLLITTLLSAQNYTFEPATAPSIENSIAALNFDASFFAEAEEVVQIVHNEFDIQFTANPVFGDLTISYSLKDEADVRLEISKGGDKFMLVDGTQGAGTQEVLWDENIETGRYTIRLIVDNKMESKKISLR